MRPLGLSHIALALLVCIGVISPLGGRPAAADALVPCKDLARRVLGGPQMETVQFRTLHIEANPTAKNYRVGETAKVEAIVTRPAEEDPTGSGVPLPSLMPTPVADVSVGIGVNVGDVFLSGFARTNSMGRATVKIKLKSYTTAGKADVTAYAYKTTVNSPCLRVDENGYRAYPKMFSIVK